MLFAHIPQSAWVFQEPNPLFSQITSSPSCNYARNPRLRMTRTYVKHATLLKCFIKSGTNWIAGIIWLQRSVLLKLLKLVWIGHTAMMDKAFWSVIFSSDNLFVKLKLLLSEEDPWEIYLVGIRLTAFADGYLGEENFPSFSIFMLSPLPVSFLSTLNVTLFFPLFVHFLLIFIQRLFHTFYFLCFSSSTFSKPCLIQVFSGI